MRFPVNIVLVNNDIAQGEEILHAQNPSCRPADFIFPRTKHAPPHLFIDGERGHVYRHAAGFDALKRCREEELWTAILALCHSLPVCTFSPRNRGSSRSKRDGGTSWGLEGSFSFIFVYKSCMRSSRYGQGQPIN